MPTLLNGAEGHTARAAKARHARIPRGPETLDMHGHFMHGSREIPRPPAEKGAVGRIGKSMDVSR